METGEVIFFLKDQCLLQQSFFFKGGGGHIGNILSLKTKYTNPCVKKVFSVPVIFRKI